MRVGEVAALAVGLAALGYFVAPGQALGHTAGVRSAPSAQSAQTSPKSIFQSVCASCHGPKGKGDGPAGMAFNPRPANFSDLAFWKTHTDTQLIQSITKGKGMMPAFGGTYDEATIQALVKYLHVLSGLTPGGSAPGA